MERHLKIHPLVADCVFGTKDAILVKCYIGGDGESFISGYKLIINGDSRVLDTTTDFLIHNASRYYRVSSYE